MLLRQRALSVLALLAAVLATVHLMGALGENAAGHHAHVGAVEDSHHGTAAPAHTADDTHASEDGAHHDESGPHAEDGGDSHPAEDSQGSCGYSAAASTAGGAVDVDGVGDPSTLVLEAARLRCAAHPGRHPRVRTPHLVKDLQVIRV